ncbi:coxsackievirus and adenovirus receptor homolog [Lampris incognitus]|uniref:coxsackievirus and adenovirus receptor homolog n=1 Tax=Lampris incognitus TaxID=2546036 RepID=UPI0024B4FB00|nr:coxsackievirus and adenovirus receptor homolog [Lampris incognitus]
MQVTSTGPQTIHKAEGDGVTLGCTYTPDSFDTGELDIEWSIVSPDITQKDHLLMSYTGGTKYSHTVHGSVKEIKFAAADPSMGDASLSIAVLSSAHSATFQCKVKKPPGVDTRKVSLVVMAKPSVPRCWVEGRQLVGEAVSLHCKSAQGSTPLKYMWSREGGGPSPLAASQDSVAGQLVISNHSESFTGVYLCKVTNAVGTEHCRIHLKAEKLPNRAGVIVGTVVGSLLLIILLLLLLWLLLCKLGDRPRYEKEVSNEIREDAPAPQSRPVSRATSRSLIRYPGVAYVGNSDLSCVADDPAGMDTQFDEDEQSRRSHKTAPD